MRSGVGAGLDVGAGGSAQPATVAALKPWGCTALEGLFLDGRGVVSVVYLERLLCTAGLSSYVSHW